MVRLVASVAAVVCLVSCASTKVVSQDFTTGSLVVCGNKYAELADLTAKAAQTCMKPQILRCAEHKYGTQTTATASTYGSTTTAYGTSTTKDLTGNCCEYQCAPAK